jgi:hypothetical protein
MQPEEIEEMLYQRAIHSKARPPLAQRLSNLAYKPMVSGGLVAATALVCALAMNLTRTTSAAGEAGLGGAVNPQVTDTQPKKQPVYQAPIPSAPDNTDPITASLAMSRVGN